MSESEFNTRISLRRLEVFCLVVEEGGVTRAAEHLLIAQPAVSSQIRALEEWAGAKVFLRTGGGLVLTPVGDLVYEWARGMLARTQQMRRDVSSLAQGTRGTVVVAASLAAGTYLLPPPLIALRDARPEVEVVIELSQPEAALRAAQTGDADLAIVAWDGRELSDDLEGEHLHSEEIVLIASPTGPPAGSKIDRTEVAALPHADVSRRAAYQRMVEAQLRRQGVGARNVLVRLGHSETIKGAVREHEMVAFLPRYAVERELATGELRRVEVDRLNLDERLWMVRRRGRPLTPLHEVVVAELRRYLSQRANTTPAEP